MDGSIKNCSRDNKLCGYIPGTGLCRKSICVEPEGFTEAICYLREDAVFINPNIGWQSKVDG